MRECVCISSTVTAFNSSASLNLFSVLHCVNQSYLVKKNCADLSYKIVYVLGIVSPIYPSYMNKLAQIMDNIYNMYMKNTYRHII